MALIVHFDCTVVTRRLTTDAVRLWREVQPCTVSKKCTNGHAARPHGQCYSILVNNNTKRILHDNSCNSHAINPFPTGFTTGWCTPFQHYEVGQTLRARSNRHGLPCGRKRDTWCHCRCCITAPAEGPATLSCPIVQSPCCLHARYHTKADIHM